jgi:DNA-binding transcriptional ArsR family regulator
MFVFTINFHIFSFYTIIPRDLFQLADLFTGKNDSQIDPRFRMILWLIIAGTRGGINRARILNLIKETPTNANKIATILKLDHKTVIHHIEILLKNELISKDDKDYGATYNLTQIMKDNQNTLIEIMKKIGTN